MAHGLMDEKVVVNGRTFRIRENGWGNVYGYIGGRRVELFWGSTDEQLAAAKVWLVERSKPLPPIDQVTPRWITK